MFKLMFKGMSQCMPTVAYNPFHYSPLTPLSPTPPFFNSFQYTSLYRLPSHLMLHDITDALSFSLPCLSTSDACGPGTEFLTLWPAGPCRTVTVHPYLWSRLKSRVARNPSVEFLLPFPAWGTGNVSLTSSSLSPCCSL
jgi:hypothetical protein